LRRRIRTTITKYLENWDLDRLGKTDKAILRLAAFEMIHYDTPKVVVINEAIELAKKYSDDKVVKLINAVLDKIRDLEVIDE
jgi:N utilization substance protein B